MKKRVVYVACALTVVPEHLKEEFSRNVKALIVKLETICIVLKFKGLSDENVPHDVYSQDINKCVRRSDLLIAICDFPSIGLGYEMGTQGEARKKPTLAVAHKDAKVTKLILDPRTPGYEFKRYENMVEDVYRMVVIKLRSLDGY